MNVWICDECIQLCCDVFWPDQTRWQLQVCPGSRITERRSSGSRQTLSSDGRAGVRAVLAALLDGGALSVPLKRHPVNPSSVLDPRSPTASEVIIAVGRGDVNQTSIGMVVADDTWSGDMSHRTINRISELLDVSVVSFPASPTTTVELLDAPEEFSPTSPARTAAKAPQARGGIRMAPAPDRARSSRPTWPSSAASPGSAPFSAMCSSPARSAGFDDRFSRPPAASSFG
jgi:Caudovirus prohead serine protease